MKKRIKNILLGVLLLIICFMPKTVKAANLVVSPNIARVKPNQTVTVTIKASGTNTFGSSQFIVKYDTSKFTYVSDRALQGSAVKAVSNGQVNITLTNPTGITDGNIYEVVLKSNSNATSGTSQISATVVDCYDEADPTQTIALVGSSSMITHYTPSSINTLKSLDGCILSPSFNSNTTSYTCKETEEASININAVATDSSATVSGTGKKNLNYGNNKINIVVTSESGTKKTYTISITRKDTRSSENGLASLSVSVGDLDFDTNKTDYTVNVDSSTTSVNIEASAVDENSKVTGMGTYELKEGDNTFFIQVTAANGLSKMYTVTIVRKNRDIGPSTKLTKIVVNGKEISLSASSKVYAIGVDSNVSVLEINCETDSATSTYKIDGNNIIKENNVVTITVSDEGVDDTIYKLVVNKNGVINTVTSLNDLANIDSNTIYKVNYSKEPVLSKDILDKIKNNLYTIYYNVVNDDDGLLYSISLNSSINYDDDLILKINKVSDNPLMYNSTIPSGMKIKLLVEQDVKYLYSYDFNTNLYTLISDDITLKDMYVDFVSNGASSYVFSSSAITNKNDGEKSAKKSEWFTRIQYLLIGVLSGAILMFFFKDKFFKNKKTSTPTIERL